MILIDKKFFVTVFLLAAAIIYSFYITAEIARAEVIFSEMMYNPEGTDTGREWVEVYNSGSNSVDLSQYKILENGTNHKINPKNEGAATILESGEYAIIADNIDKFIADFNISGLILDSAFSLKNDGEEINLINDLGETVDSLNYLPDWGANGTGNSLQLHSEVWIPAEPTPGAINKTESADENLEDDSVDSTDTSTDESNSTHSDQTDLSKFTPKENLKISIGRDRYVSVNTPIEFRLEHNQESDEKTSKNKGIKAIWSFGDGNSGRGTSVKNVFYNSGEYNVISTAKMDDDQAVSRTKIYVTDPVLRINLVNSGKHVDIMLINDSAEEVNIGEFILETSEKSFKIPKDTIISAKKHITINHRTSDIENFSGLKLLFPTGDVATGFSDSEKLLDLITISTDENRKALIDLINKL
jgi:hypothetical protein